MASAKLVGVINKVLVSEKLVSFDSKIINELLETPTVDESVLEALIANPDYDLILRILCYSVPHGRHLFS